MPLASISSSDLAQSLEAARASCGRARRSWLLPTYGPREAGCLAAGVATSRGVVTVGDAAECFTLMSAIKPFLLLHLLETLGPEAVFETVGKRPSDAAFFCTDQLAADGLRPRNPMLNSGAMLLCTYLQGETPQAQCEGLLRWLNERAGTALAVDHATLEAMLSKPDSENTKLAKMLARAGHVADARAAFEVYFWVCCLAGTVADVARLGLLLAFPRADLAAQNQAMTTGLMLTCGLYEASPEWAVEVGLPTKSGVSGCLVAIVPGEGALATHTPWLDAGGNPLVGMAMLRQMAGELMLGRFAPRAEGLV